MRTGSSGKILLLLLLVTTITALYFCLGYEQKLREFRRWQEQMSNINRQTASARQLIQDVAEYSSHDPAVLPILKSAGVTVQPGTNAGAMKPLH